MAASVVGKHVVTKSHCEIAFIVGLFHPPVRTSDGEFSILVEHQTIESVTNRCGGGVSIFVEVLKTCVKSNETMFEKSHSCDDGGGGGEGECLAAGDSCSSDSECCSANVPAMCVNRRLIPITVVVVPLY